VVVVKKRSRRTQGKKYDYFPLISAGFHIGCPQQQKILRFCKIKIGVRRFRLQPPGMPGDWKPTE
jgi:hypothetical protein